MNQPQPQTAPITLPDIPAVAINARQAAMLTTDGEIRILKHDQAAQELNKQSVLLCHAPYTTQTLNLKDINPFDLLELFAFVHPAKFCVPTPVGLATALGLSPPTSFDDYPFTLMECAKALLSDLRADIWQAKANPLHIARVMGKQGPVSYTHLTLPTILLV